MKALLLLEDDLRNLERKTQQYNSYGWVVAKTKVWDLDSWNDFIKEKKKTREASHGLYWFVCQVHLATKMEWIEIATEKKSLILHSLCVFIY